MSATLGSIKRRRTSLSEGIIAAIEAVKTAGTDEQSSIAHQHAAEQLVEVCTQLSVDPNKGLTAAEVKERLERFGPNELEGEEKVPWWRIFLNQMSSMLVIMLLVAAIVSGALNQVVECVAILILVIGMAILGTYQEVRAGDSLDALKSMSAPNATVIRDGGNVATINAAELVPGDILLLESGRTIPADGRLIETQGLVCAEAVLTGESAGVKKDAMWIEGGEEKGENVNQIFMGCTVVEGRAKAVVTLTGMKTRMGQVAELMNTADATQSPLQVRLDALGKQLGWASMAVSIVVWIIGVTTGRGLDPHIKQNKYLQMTLIAVGLTVAAVPEALPTMVTITLAMGMGRMSKRKALLRNLHGTVTLAATTVICSDKTGTLTAGAMTAVRVWADGLIWRISGIGFSPYGSVFPDGTNIDDKEACERAAASCADDIHIVPAAIGTLCSNVVVQSLEEKDEQGRVQYDIIGNMTEKPLVVAGLKVGLRPETLNASYPRVGENGFDSKRKMMSVLVGLEQARNVDPNGLASRSLFKINDLRNAQYAACVKGAPNFVLDKCTKILRKNGQCDVLSAGEKAKILEQIDVFSDQALRVLALAVRPFNDMPKTDPDTLECDLILTGMYASIDPERPEVRGAIETAYRAGIRVVAISGDYTKTLFAICKNIGLLAPDAPFSKVVDCEAIRADGEASLAIEAKLKQQGVMWARADKAEMKKELDAHYARIDRITAHVDAFGRAKPQDKITILKSLQRQGHIAAMTGDGVNDAPALKQANIGVAMGITGTDAAKAASSMILVDDSFGTIVAGVEEGRAIFRNISIFIFMLLSQNTAEVFFVLISVCIGQQAPLDAIQLLLLNLFTDGAPAVALAVEESGNDVLMSEGPRNQNESIVSPIMVVGMAIHVPVLCGLCMMNYTLALIRWTGNWKGAGGTTEQQRKANTVSFLYIVCAELLRAYTGRSLREAIWKIGFFTNRWMQTSVFLSMAIVIGLTNIPTLNKFLGFEYLPWEDWVWILTTALIPCLVEEFVKAVYRWTGYGKRKIAIRGDLKQTEAPEIVISNGIDKTGENPSGDSAAQTPVLRVEEEKNGSTTTVQTLDPASPPRRPAALPGAVEVVEYA